MRAACDRPVSTAGVPARSYSEMRALPYRHQLLLNANPGQSAVMDGEPNGHLFWIGPQDAVAPVRHDMNVIAGTQWPSIRFVLEEQPRAAPKQNHPFVPVLVIPVSRRTRLSGRDDALDLYIGTCEKVRHCLVGERCRRQLREHVSMIGHGQASLTTDLNASCHRG